MDYGEVIQNAWKITWKFKVLWIFGILAGCGQSQGGSFNSNFNSGFKNGITNGGGPNFNGNLPGLPNMPPAMIQAITRFVNLFKNPNFIWQFVAAVVAIVCVIVIVQIFLGTLGRIGLIKGSAEADGGAEELRFGELWKESTPYFWRVFWLSFLVGTPFLVLFIVWTASLLAALIPLAHNIASESVVLLILLPVICIFFCVIVILATIVGFISTQAERAIVLEDKSILDGFRRGWEVLTANLGPILIIWLITAAIGFVASVVIALPLLVVMAPLVIAFFANMNNLNFSFMPWIIAFVCIVCAYAPISWLAGGILMTYLQSVWTLTYIRLTKPKQEEQTPVALPTNA